MHKEVEIVNQIIADIVEESAGRAVTSDPLPLSEGRALAPPQGQGGKRMGVQHIGNEGKRLRQAAQQASKRLQWHDQQLRKASKSGMCDNAWYEEQAWELKTEADCRWDRAEKLSWELGHPFKDRLGHMVFPKPVKLGILEKTLMELQRQIAEDGYEWPPA